MTGYGTGEMHGGSGALGEMTRMRKGGRGAKQEDEDEMAREVL